MVLQIRRIDSSTEDARQAIAALRRELSPEGNVVSPEGRARTIAAFGEPLAPRQVVERVCADVAARGLDAVLDYSRRIDGVTLEAGQVRVSREELSEAHQGADPAYLATIARVRGNILAYQEAIRHRDVILERGPGIELGLLYRPLRRVGVCIPGGAAAYPSSLLMTVVPAQAAGVGEIAVVVPPSPFGGFNTDILAACHALGVTEVYRIGGAQGVASLAYGLAAIGLEPVDKIVGPGNLFVALAKRHVYGTVDIDSIAGPSEVVVITDRSAVPRFVAADLISQAEHSPGASILLTWERGLIDEVTLAVEDQLSRLSRGGLARDSLERFGAMILVRDEDEAVTIANLIAPEHLHVSTGDPKRLLPRLTNAGAIFLGHFTPVAAGDYAAGPSHVLPTGGTARWGSGLSANDFLKRSSLIALSRDGLAALAPDIRLLADKEGLSGHRLSVDLRLADGLEQGLTP
ncbi:MAG: histidinol dehydrogenase [Isosphaerales bacterium]